MVYFVFFFSLGCSNSKPLNTAAGYWADPFPVMESPLCAVIDPVRDFRWHALRCGGPETAAFLCEMEGNFLFRPINGAGNFIFEN